MNLHKTIHPLLWRVVVFLSLIIIVSAALGPRIISGGILFRDGFALYGGIGKAVIFSIITLVLLVRHRKAPLNLTPWSLRTGGWMVASAVAFMLAWSGTSRLLAGQRSTLALAAAHGGLLACIVLAALGCFGVSNLRLLWRNYRREIIAACAVGVAFYLFLLAVYALWQPLASLVLVSVNGLLGISGVHGVVVPPNGLLFDKFGITVAQYCSGIESIALFTGLYAVVGLMDRDRLKKRRYFTVFPFALLVLCGLNILRVYGLILAGYYINPKIAFTLFHTYAGMLFFILYSAVFWLVAYKYLVTTPRKKAGM